MEQVQNLDGSQSPEHTNAVTKVFQRLHTKPVQTKSEELTGPIVLIELMAEVESYAVYLLNRQGIERVDLTTFQSHGSPSNRKARRPTHDDEELSFEDEDEMDDDPILEEFGVELVQRVKRWKN